MLHSDCSSKTTAHRPRFGFTVWEAMVVVFIVLILLALILPILRTVRDDGMTMQSMANLRVLGVSHRVYWGDHNGNQWTVTPHNLAEFGDTVNQAVWGYNQWACGGWCGPGQGITICSSGNACVELGWACMPDGLCKNWYWGAPYDAAVILMPISFATTGGYFRMLNVKSFNQYVGGMFYDSTFYAPKDWALIDMIGECFDAPSEFCFPEGYPFIVRSSYAMSPAAMFDPEMWSVPVGEFPASNAEVMTQWPSAFQAPTIAQVRHPDLKTHIMEHNWLQNFRVDDPCHRDLTVPGHCIPWYFTHSIDSAPATLFYDGHVRLLPNKEVQKYDRRTELWRRDTAFGTDGYFLDHAADDVVNVSHHILTKGGARGRDTLGPLR